MINKYTFHTEKRIVRDLIPYQFNPRKLSEKSADDLKKSLDKFGLVEIPVINTDGTIIAGHQRLKVMAALGCGGEEIDVRVPDRFMDDKDFQEYNIRSNKNSGEWDFDALANAFDNEDLLNWGFESFELGMGNGKAEIDIDKGAADAEKFLNAGIKQVVLYFKAEDYDILLPELDEILKENDIENYSDLFLFLKKFYEDHSA